MSYKKMKIKYSKIGHAFSKKMENLFMKFYIRFLEHKNNIGKESRKIINNLGKIVNNPEINPDEYRKNPGYWR